jgi:nitroreductase
MVLYSSASLRKKNMNIESAIQNCRIVKSFDPSHKMTEKQVKEMLSLLFHAPSSVNVLKWQFVVVQDEEVRIKLREAVWNQDLVSDATLLIILCVDLRVWNAEPLPYWHATNYPGLEPSFPVLHQYALKIDAVQRDEIMRSCGMVSQTLMLIAQSMGHDACPIAGFDPECVGEAINLPDEHAVCAIMAVGRSTGNTDRESRELPVDESVVRNTY